MINSIIPIWKPVNWTSFDVVKKIRTQIKPSKVGHAGTLDPFAEGVLMLCSGEKTKSIEYIMNQTKVYEAEICLGIETDTLDPTGKIIKIKKIKKLSKIKIKNVISKFIGDIKQEPPMYSALKFNGIPLYKLARMGILIDRVKKQIKIHKIILNDYSKNTINITVECGRGTYIRSLAKDIALQLGTVGYLQKLKRTKIGNINRNSCLTIDEFPEWLSSKILKK